MNLFGLIAPFVGVFLVIWILSRMIVSEASPDRLAFETAPDHLNFVPNRHSYWGVYGFSLCLLYVVVVVLINGIHSVQEAAPAVLCSGFVLLLFGAFPGSIAVNPNAVSQFYWLWRTRRIEWKDIARVEVDDKKRRVTITDMRGKKIVHTRQLPDRARLLAEIERRRPEKVPEQYKRKTATSV